MSLNNDKIDSSKNIAKNEFGSFQTLLRLFRPALFVECRPLFLELNSQGLYPGLKRERKICPCTFTTSIESRIQRFHVKVMQWTLRK